MSYEVIIIESTARIPKDKVSLAIELAQKMMSVPAPADDPWSHLHREHLAKSPPDLDGFFLSFGYEAVFDDAGDFEIWSFQGGRSEDSDLLLISLAPAIIGDLIWEGEEYERFKHSFNFDKVYESRMLPMEFGPGIELT